MNGKLSLKVLCVYFLSDLLGGVFDDKCGYLLVLPMTIFHEEKKTFFLESSSNFLTGHFFVLCMFDIAIIIIKRFVSDSFVQNHIVT